MRLRDAIRELAQLGISLRKQDGEFQVKPRWFGGKEVSWDDPRVYFTPDLEDALNTGRRMAEERDTEHKQYVELSKKQRQQDEEEAARTPPPEHAELTQRGWVGEPSPGFGVYGPKTGWMYRHPERKEVIEFRSKRMQEAGGPRALVWRPTPVDRSEITQMGLGRRFPKDQQVYTWESIPLEEYDLDGSL